MKQPIVEMINISKSFPGVKAVDNVSLKIYGGEVLGLLGENGAGKSTLMKILFGAHQKDEGKILVNAKEVEIKNVKDSQRLGISGIYQELSVLPNLKVYENIFLGMELKKGIHLDKKSMIDQSRKVLKSLGVKIDPVSYLNQLSVGERQIVEIGKALLRNSKVLIMDEPTTALTPDEVEHLFKIVEHLKSNGIAIVYISHKMDEIFRICDRVMVLRDGKFVGEKKINETTKDEIVSMMVGREISDYFPYEKAKGSDVALKVENLSCKGKFQDVSFELKKNEILGFFGLLGAGRTELAKGIFGAYGNTEGNLYIEGRKVEIRSPKDAIKNGIVYLSEDRKSEGLITKLSVIFNLSLSTLQNYEKPITRRLDRKKELKDFQKMVEKLSIKVSSPEEPIKNLSGGNQQKILIAKWLLSNPKIMIIDEPTRGIDVGAKREIYSLLNNLKNSGKAIMLISSEMEELLGISDRIAVVYKGRIVKILSRDEATQEEIMKYAIGLGG